MQTLNPHDRAYYEARAEAELNLAQHSIDSCAVKIHYDLANRYLAILYGGADERPAFAALAPSREGVSRHRTGG